jgi:hypothetical protein
MLMQPVQHIQVASTGHHLFCQLLGRLSEQGQLTLNLIRLHKGITADIL